MSGLISLSRSLARPILVHSKTKTKNVTQTLVPKRTQIVYREEHPALDSSAAKQATLMGFLTVLWIGIYGYYHMEMLTGHFPTIDPSVWTDEELGIPADEEDVFPEGYAGKQ